MARRSVLSFSYRLPMLMASHSLLNIDVHDAAVSSKLGIQDWHNNQNRLLPMRKVILYLFAATSLLLTTSGYSADSKQVKQDRPKIGVVLGGGGARGIAHIGVLRVLEENNIPIDYIAGTSMGSIVGGLYASGISLDKLEDIISRIDWLESFEDRTEREERSFRRKQDDRLYLVQHKPGLSDDGELKFPSGLLQGQRIDLLLAKLTLPVAHVKDFDNLEIPYRAVAADITTGDAVVLSKGELNRAMRASMNIPAVFSPVEIDGRLLVDGFVANNVPIDVARDMGAEIIIAVDVGTPLRKKDELDSLLSVADQITGILSVQNTKRQVKTLTEKDVLIVPDLGELGPADFKIAGDAIPPGREAANAQLDKLRRYSLSETQYAAYRDKLQIRRQAPTVAFIRIDNKSGVSDEAISSRISIQPGDQLDVSQLEADIGKVYGLELFQNVNYSIVEENGETGVEIHAEEKSWGPNYIQFGIAASNNLEGESVFNIAAAYTRTAINSLGGEWRTALQLGENPLLATEIYQPLDATQTYFINPLVFARADNVNLFGNNIGDQIAEYRVSSYGVRLEGGRNFGTYAELRFGYNYEKGDVELRVGDPGLDEFDFENGFLMTRFTLDRIDNINFPRKGYFSRLEYRYYDEDLGGDSNFDQAELDTLITHSWGKDTLFAGVRFFTTPDDDAPIQSLFRAGGFVNLSGFNQDELSGQHYGVVRVGYQRRINDFNLIPAYLGATLEYGNVWQDDNDIFDDNITAGSIYLGLDTPVGPIYGAYGHAEGGNDSLYLFLGKLF